VIKPITGLFLIFWGLVKVFQGWVLLNGGNDFGAAVMVFGVLAAAVGGLFLRDSLR
jgi:hypothetical protein